MDFNYFSPSSGKLKARVTGPIIGPNIHRGAIYLIRVNSNVYSDTTSIYVREARLKNTFKNVGQFEYLDGKLFTLELTSDRILCKLKTPTEHNIGIFPLSSSYNIDNIEVWNSYADFRVWVEELHTFEGTTLHAIKIYSVKPDDTDAPLYLPKYPRFSVGEIALTNYEGKVANVVPGLEYGYVRIDRVCQEYVPVGTGKVPIISYSVRRSWKGISMEDWNQFSRIIDYIQGEELTIKKLPVSMQSKIRSQLFDPFYR